MGRCRLQALKCKASKWLLASKHLMYKAETVHLSEGPNLQSCSPPCIAGYCGDKQGSACLYFWLQHAAIASFLFPTHPLWGLALPPTTQGNSLSNHMTAMTLTSSCSIFPINPLHYTLFQSLTAIFFSSFPWELNQQMLYHPLQILICLCFQDTLVS